MTQPMQVKNNTQSELFEPASYLNCLSTGGGPAYFSTMQIIKNPDGTESKELNIHPVERLPYVVESIYGARCDSYITQAVFSSHRERSVATIKTLGSNWGDLDTYHNPDLKGLDAEAQAARLRAFCLDTGVPPPSTILFSGRGLQPKWLLTSALGRERIPEWRRMAEGLHKRLVPFSCDPSATKNPASFLRMEQTINTKTGVLARVVHVEGGDLLNPVRYDFDQLAKAVVPPSVSMDELQDCDLGEARPAARLHRDQLLKFTFVDLAWARYDDLLKLATARAGRLVGYRELYQFWAMAFIGRTYFLRDEGQFWRHAEQLAARFGYFDEFRPSALGTLFRKVSAHVAGERTTFNGKEYPTIYTPKTSTLLDIFQPSPEEQRYLSAIISPEEKDRRRAEKRWAAGSKPHAQSFERTRPWEFFGISQRTWYRKGKPLPPSDSP